MSRYISSSELWDSVYKRLAYPSSPRGKENIDIQTKYGDMQLNHYSTGFGIIYTSLIATFNEETIVENTNADDSYFLSFNTGSEVLMVDMNNNKQMKWEKDICLNGKKKSGHMSQVIYPKDKQAIIHYIGFGDKLFKGFVENNKNFKNSKQVFKGEYIDVNFNNHINTQQKLLLDDLLETSNLDDKVQMLYLESKLLDLIYTSLNLIESKDKTQEITLSTKDIEYLEKAKNLLIENMENPPSIKTLAYKCALNEFKLKKGFKQLFGNTPYAFLQDYRLNKAKKLLETDEINVSEACTMVGYKCKSHFSKIFKEQFGITPMEIKSTMTKN